ncbi:hypothetical protein [Pyrobaculum sp.]|uniref:hypothetical protein n=1 Tax=Pyrobaculum sp. TaxID=2004705 RepID=UPI0031616B46
MHEVYTLALMVALAALIVATGGYVVWHFQNAEKVAEWGEAYVYPLARPLNTTHFWLGAQAAFADVQIKRVVVDDVQYPGASAPAGRGVWLNYSGKPLLVKCNSTVTFEVERGKASRALTFKAVCPTGERVRTVYAEDVAQIVREMNAFASMVFSKLENTSLLAVDVVDDGKYAYIALYNTWKYPLLVFGAQYETAFTWPWVWDYAIVSPTPPGPWGLLYNLTTTQAPYNPNDYAYHFLGTLMPNESLAIWQIGDVWKKTPSPAQYPDKVELAVNILAYLTGDFAYINGRIMPTAGQTVVTYRSSQYVGTVWQSPPFSGRESPTVYFRAVYGDVLTYNVTLNTYPTLSWKYDYKNLGRGGATTVVISNSVANDYMVYYGRYNPADPWFIIYAFPAMPVTANTSSTGGIYLNVNNKPVYGQSAIQGIAGLSPIRVYAVEARNNYTHWLISAGVPGFDPVQDQSILSAVGRQGWYKVEASTGYVSITTPDGRVYEQKTPYWTDPVPGFKTYKSPIVAYLTPGGGYWIAIAGYRPSDNSLLVKSNAPLSCSAIAPGLYVLPLGGQCRWGDTTVKYFVEALGGVQRLSVEVWTPVAYNLPGLPGGRLVPLVYKAVVRGGDPKALFDRFSKIRAVWVEAVNGTYARSYIADYPGDASVIPPRPSTGAKPAKNGTQFSLPVLYDVSPRGVKPYVLRVWANELYPGGVCISSSYRQWISYFGAELYYGGRPVSLYRQGLKVVRVDGSCSPQAGEQPISLSPTCWSARFESFINQTQKNFRKNPDGTYYTEIWGRFKIYEMDCTGTVRMWYEERQLNVVRRGVNIYAVADPQSGKVCGMDRAYVGNNTKEVRCR